MAVRHYSYPLRGIVSQLLLISCCLLLSISATAASISGQVFAVKRGDRITLFLESGKFREVQFAGIEAPDPGLPAGRISKRYLHNFLAGKFVTVQYQSLTPQAVILGKVLHGGADMNLRMIEVGLARIKAGEKLGSETLQHYEKAQRQAQKMRLGMWK